MMSETSKGLATHNILESEAPAILLRFALVADLFGNGMNTERRPEEDTSPDEKSRPSGRTGYARTGKRKENQAEAWTENLPHWISKSS